MARISFEAAEKLTSGGGSFFKLEDGDKKNVRFLYNTLEEVKNSALSVHEFNGEKFATIDCCRQEGEALDVCKWCAMGNNPVARVILPIYDVESGEIQYWKKSLTFVKNTLIPAFESIPPTLPISGQVFTLGRTGKTMTDTKYTAAPNLSAPNDGRKKEEFGEVKDPFEMNMIKPNNYDFNSQSTQTQPSVATPNTFTATRRTTDVF